MNDSYFEIANVYILTKVGEDCAIVMESIQDLDDFYCFTYQSKSYLKMGNNEPMLVGQGYNFIHKKDKRIFSYGSGFPLETALHDLRERLRIETKVKRVKNNFELEKQFDLLVTTIHKKQIFIDTFLKFDISFVTPEIVGDSTFRIPKRYTKNVLLEKIKDLPASFKSINSRSCLYLADDLIKNECCDFDLI